MFLLLKEMSGRSAYTFHGFKGESPGFQFAGILLRVRFDKPSSSFEGVEGMEWKEGLGVSVILMKVKRHIFL